jgi:2-hydroxy-3-keto-5-methylthiopentenyl-1-phosphate phosphatase
VFRPGFWEFLKATQSMGRRFVVVSEGLAEYITPFFGPEVPIYSNECGEGENGLYLKTPHSSANCDKCGNCKKALVLGFKKEGDTVVYIGDGTSDFCASEHADLIFARRSLAQYLKKRGVAFVPYEDFFEIQREIEKIRNI